MAEEKHEKEKGGEKKGNKKPKLKLHAITTTKADDGSFVHEHHYVGKGGEHHPPRFGGTSTDMQDLHDHMEDHFGGGAEQQEDGEDAEPEQGGAQGAPAAAPAQGM